MLSANDPRNFLLQKLSSYKPADTLEQESYDQIVKYIETCADCFNNSNFNGHITGSAFIVDAQRKSTLLVHHKKLNEWLQFGGHSDSSPDTVAVATREAFEESGLKSLRLVSAEIFDIDAHMIPEHKDQPAHWHFDIRFLFIADMTEPFVVSHESNDIKWFSLAELIATNKNKTIPRMAKKALTFAL